MSYKLYDYRVTSVAADGEKPTLLASGNDIQAKSDETARAQVYRLRELKDIDPDAMAVVIRPFCC